MKVARNYTIDYELLEKMQNLNASELINTLLKEYFELRSDKNTLKDEKKAVFDAISKKKSNFLKKLRLLIHGIHLALIIFLRHGFGRGKKFLQELKLNYIFEIDHSNINQKISQMDAIYSGNIGRYLHE